MTEVGEGEALASSSDVRLMIDWNFHLWEGDGAEAAKLAAAGQLFRWHG